MIDWSLPIKLLGILVYKLYVVKFVVPLKFEKCYIHNFFTIISQQILSDKLLLVVFSKQK